MTPLDKELWDATERFVDNVTRNLSTLERARIIQKIFDLMKKAVMPPKKRKSE